MSGCACCEREREPAERLTLPRLLTDLRKGQLERFYRMPYVVDQWDRRIPRWDGCVESQLECTESVPGKEQALVKVHAASINLIDWKVRTDT
jgi:hypothetical protein